MNVLIDTNIVLDVLLSRAGLKEGSANILKYCESKFVNGYISAMTVANITYILRKDLNREKVLVILSKIFCIFNVEDLRSDDLLNAASLDFSDYEDAVQASTAERIKAEYIVTRNLKDYKNSTVPPITPEEFLESFVK